MAMYMTASACYVTTNPRMVGTAHVWDVVRETGTTVLVAAVVGKIVLRDGVMYARDLTSCGKPLYLPSMQGNRLINMLAGASFALFGDTREVYPDGVRVAA